MDRDAAVSLYFHLGFEYKEILCALAVNHGIVVCLRTLKRLLRRQNLFRRKRFSDILDVSLFIFEQMRGSGYMHGYRWMHRKCLQCGIKVSRKTVYSVMKVLDPEGIEIRKKGRLKRRKYFSKGPNYLWHIDSYDKLKPFGLCINGCIDGFSRRLIWLNVYCTSSDPKVIGGYYIEAVSELVGCPKLVRGDMGTENSHVARMQTLLSGEESFLYGASMHNQRIESFWSILRKECSQFWIDTLGSLKDNGDFTGSLIDKSLVQFCFSTLVQRDLDSISSVWNSHRIRQSKNENVPHGRPSVLYLIPEMYSTRNYIQAVDQRDVNVCKSECHFRTGPTCDPLMFDLLVLYMSENNFSPPRNAQEGIDLYLNLRRLCLFDLLE